MSMLALRVIADRGTGIVAYGPAWLFGWVHGSSELCDRRDTALSTDSRRPLARLTAAAQTCLNVEAIAWPHPTRRAATASSSVNGAPHDDFGVSVVPRQVGPTPS